MEQSKIDRINELARLSKERELTETELEERRKLRAEYLAGWRRGAKRVLENTFIDYGNGKIEKLERKEK